ncbi:ABC transporter permease [Lichenihabitans psoromatis]|uniref:ABC transporter permease n=1 Tax=Lichenihabitans psoromatis TaxID=2528642 RepID=UPI001FE16904|nr:ABC transporter permease [Lichenihabitans psoromatis]
MTLWSRRPGLAPLPAAACVVAIAALFWPVAWRGVAPPVDPDADPLDAVGQTTWTALSWGSLHPALAVAALVLTTCLVCDLVVRKRSRRPRLEALMLTPAILAGAALPFWLLAFGLALGVGAWLMVAAVILLVWRVLTRLSEDPGWGRSLVVPAVFGILILYLWEVVVRGFGVPLILLPPPSLVAVTAFGNGAILAGDFTQTVLRSALRGYLIGCSAGLAIAILCDRFPALGRGLLPYGNLVSAVPMVGIAPIMIMWFGFGWESKAAVVVVTTLFPMLTNTLAGLATTERLQLDLMRSYAAGYWRTLLMVRLPNALPFIFNALKINSTFALISAIVAEFFGTPIAGMGFRISTEVARMNLGMVWATILVAAVTGSALYGGLSLLERAVTSWHPSYRGR